jgi:hypothetical protein
LNLGGENIRKRPRSLSTLYLIMQMPPLICYKLNCLRNAQAIDNFMIISHLFLPCFSKPFFFLALKWNLIFFLFFEQQLSLSCDLFSVNTTWSFIISFMLMNHDSDFMIKRIIFSARSRNHKYWFKQFCKDTNFYYFPSNSGRAIKSTILSVFHFSSNLLKFDRSRDLIF